MARVLLVEDEPEQLEIRKAILVHAGHDVEAVSSWAEALQRSNGCQVVVMDLIPQSDELLARLDPGLRVIVLSGREPNGAEFSRPVDLFLAKPCPSRKLLDAIEKLSA